MPKRLVIGGSFTMAGSAAAGGLAMWNGEYWEVIAGGPSGVSALTVLPDGQLLAAGDVASGASQVTCVSRFDGTTWTTLGSGFVGSIGSPSATIYALAILENGDIVAGGKFLTASGVASQGVAKWTGAKWEAIDPGLNGVVRAVLALPGNEFIVGGSFATTVAGAEMNYIAKWNGTAWIQLGTGMASAAASRGVYSLAILANGDLIAGGSFSSAGGTSAANIARWNGTSWTAFGTGVSHVSTIEPSVRALKVLPGDNVIAAGSFNTAGGGAASNIAQWNGVSWSTLGSGANGQVLCLTSDEVGNVFAGGLFPSAGGVKASHVAKWSGTSWSALGPLPADVNNWVYSLAVLPNGNTAAGGNFTTAGGIAARYIAQWNGAEWSPLGTAIYGTVSALATASNGDLIAGGSFVRVNGQGLHRIGRWNGTAWSNLGDGIGGSAGGFPSSSVNAIAEMPNGDVVAGGTFLTASGTAAVNIARWNGSSWFPLGAGASGAGSDNAVLALAVLPNGDLVAGGKFTQAGGSPASNIARWDGSTWSPMGSGMSGLAGPGVFALLVLPSGDLIAGGTFYYAGGVNVNSIAKWDGNAWSALGSGVSGPGNFFPRVHALTQLPNGDLCAAGFFGSAGGVPANCIARWDGTTWSPLAEGVSGLEQSTQVRALAKLPGGDIAVGGYFTVAGVEDSNFWARWSESNVPWTAVPPESKTLVAGETLTLSATPATGFDAVSFQWRRDDADVLNGDEGAAPGGGTVFGASGSFPFSTNGVSTHLRIEHSTHFDAGTYSVLFSNSCGESLSAPAQVKVKAHITDINADGQVDDADFILFSAQYDLMLCADASMPDSCSADFNHDGVVDDADFEIFVPAFNAMLF
ncbi:MAG: hypothetical protein JNM86_13635 [Phycisphaerae bacterium]|nr:hypothetical protein [Phycisphaerae bacterium]